MSLDILSFLYGATFGSGLSAILYFTIKGSKDVDNTKSTNSDGCGKEIQPHPKVKMPCGEIAGGKQVYCEDCENNIESTKGESEGNI